MIMMLALCSCMGTDDPGKKEIITNPAVETVIFDMDTAAIKTFIEDNYSLKKDYYLGNGIRTLVPGKDLTEGNVEVFPVYRDNSLAFLIIDDKDKEGYDFITDSEIMDAFQNDIKNLLLEIDGNIYYLSADIMIPVYGDKEFQLTEEMQKLLETYQSQITEDNVMGETRQIIKMTKPLDPDDGSSLNGETVKIDGKKYCSHRIIVIFKEGDRADQIAKYESFCKGTVQSDNTDYDYYVFEFDPLDATSLKGLLENTEKLSYIESASLDPQIELIDPIKPKG